MCSEIQFSLGITHRNTQQHLSRHVSDVLEHHTPCLTSPFEYSQGVYAESFAGWDFSAKQTFGDHQLPLEGCDMVVEIQWSSGTSWSTQKYAAVNPRRQSWEPVQELTAYFSKLSCILQRR